MGVGVGVPLDGVTRKESFNTCRYTQVVVNFGDRTRM